MISDHLFDNLMLLAMLLAMVVFGWQIGNYIRRVMARRDFQAALHAPPAFVTSPLLQPGDVLVQVFPGSPDRVRLRWHVHYVELQGQRYTVTLTHQEPS